MSLLEALKEILDFIGIKIERVEGAVRFSFKLGSENKVTKIDTVNVIQIGEDNPELNEQVKKLIEQSVGSDIPLLEASAAKDVEETQQGMDLPEEDIELLEYYRGKISSRLHTVLELSLILRNMGREGADIRGFKLRIMNDYPIYGRNMTRLVNEGYFENKFKEIYEEMSKSDDFEIVQYQEEIEYQVRKLPSMVFVDSRTDYSALLSDGRWKLRQMITRGLEEVTIHAIGHQNVQLAEQLLNDLSEEEEHFRLVIDNAHIVKRPTYYKAVLRKKY